MGNFRTVADLKTEVLTKAGEPTNGNSSYDSLALTYLNKAHQVIIGGGNIFNLVVDEAWTWARSKYPMILELQPAYSTTITVTNGSRTASFAFPAPPSKMQGWYIQMESGENHETVYRAANHSAASTGVTLDSNFLGASGTYKCKVFQLEYVLNPQFINIDSTCDRIDYVEAGSTERTLPLAHGAYTPTELIAYVVGQMNGQAPGGLVYTGTYDAVAKIFAIESNLNAGAVFKLLGATGTNRRRSVLPALGFDRLDFTGLGTYVGTNIIGTISRLIEPFKIYSSAVRDPYIYSNDAINMDLDYPVWGSREGKPTHFCKVNEDNEGTVTVRFNSYPKEKTRVEVNWIPVPLDLQNNNASFPLIPRKDIDVLIHAAVAFIEFDKEDTKFADSVKLVGDQLTAMMKKNRAEMRRTDNLFGEIVPRQDYVGSRRRNLSNYGYDAGDR